MQIPNIRHQTSDVATDPSAVNMIKDTGNYSVFTHMTTQKTWVKASKLQMPNFHSYTYFYNLIQKLSS